MFQSISYCFVLDWIGYIEWKELTQVELKSANETPFDLVVVAVIGKGEQPPLSISVVEFELT